jgi:hypothetical protein
MQAAIFQEKNEMNNFLDKKGIPHRAVVEVGPFPSRMQASQWMEFVARKHAEQKMECFSCGYMNTRPWYGYIFE